MEILYIVFTTLTFGFILFNIINNKHLSIISSILFIVLVLFYLMKVLDEDYYNNLVSGIKNIDLYSTIASASSLLISIIEYIVGSFQHKRKLNKKQGIKKEKKNKKEKVSTDLETVDFDLPQDTNAFNIVNDDLLVYLELMDEPIACLVNDDYIVNNKMKKLLNQESYKVNKQVFLSFINKEDFKTYKEENKTNNFRFNINDEIWYEEAKANLKGTTYKLVREAKNIKTNKVTLKSFNELTKLLKEYKHNNENYYLVFFDLMNTSDISGFYGTEFLDLVINKFLKKINNLSYIYEPKLFYISKTEYVILLDDKVEYNILLSELENKSSEILRQEITISNEKVIIKSKVGLIDSSKVLDNTITSVINKGFDTLKLASSINYKGDFAIYNPVDDEISYSAKDLNIDLDIDIDQYKKRLK